MAPVFDVLGSATLDCGALGAGQVVKLANNLVACGNLAILAEAYELLEAGGARSTAGGASLAQPAEKQFDCRVVSPRGG